MASEPLSQSTVRDLLLPGVCHAMHKAFPEQEESVDWDILFDPVTDNMTLRIGYSELPPVMLGPPWPWRPFRVYRLATREQLDDQSYKKLFNARVRAAIAAVKGEIEYASWLPAA